MSAARPLSLGRRMGVALLLQPLLISVMAVLGVALAYYLLTERILKQALVDEAQHYWALHDEHAAPPPSTRNLTGYVTPGDSRMPVPAYLLPLTPGFHELAVEGAEDDLAYVVDRGDKRLYLVFHGKRVRELTIYFGVVPLALVLVALYLLSWIANRTAQHALSPIYSLAREVKHMDPGAPSEAAKLLGRLPPGSDEEVQSLIDAFGHFTARLQSFVDRERNFTRDASHELRSPLTVIKTSAEMLAEQPGLGPAGERSVARIQRAANEMQGLTEAFLALSRETTGSLRIDRVNVNNVVEQELQRASQLHGREGVEMRYEPSVNMVVEGSETVLSILLGNLLRNAFAYTDKGTVTARVEQNRVVVEDQGRGMSPDFVLHAFKPHRRESAGEGNAPGEYAGHGVGLTIVKRLSDRFDWPVSIESEPGVGTRVTVQFPRAELSALSAG